MSTPISLKHLEFFIKIVDCGGLSEAAAQLNVSPSAVSKSLAAMEDTLGTTLIKRTTRSITLTDAGHYLFNRADKLLQEFNNILNTSSGYYHIPHGELRITCSIAFGYSHLVKRSQLHVSRPIKACLNPGLFPPRLADNPDNNLIGRPQDDASRLQGMRTNRRQQNHLSARLYQRTACRHVIPG